MTATQLGRELPFLVDVFSFSICVAYPVEKYFELFQSWQHFFAISEKRFDHVISMQELACSLIFQNPVNSNGTSYYVQKCESYFGAVQFKGGEGKVGTYRPRSTDFFSRSFMNDMNLDFY